jgi:hypothetical protein
MLAWVTGMRLWPLLLVLLFGAGARAQQFEVKLSGMATDYFTGTPLKGVLVRVVKAGRPDEQVTTGKSGRYAFTLERGWKYEVWFSKQDLVGKHVVVDTRDVPAYPDVPFYDMDLQITLFAWVPDIDLAVFLEPMGEAAYKAKVHNMSWDTPYTEQRRPILERVMAEYEKTHNGYYERTGRIQREAEH